MLNSPLALELANQVIRERLHQAEREALLDQLAGASRSTPATRFATLARRSLASSIRGLAVRLDPTLECQPVVAALSSSR